VLAGISGSSANNTIGLLGEIETIESRPINKTNSAIQMDSIFFFQIWRLNDSLGFDVGGLVALVTVPECVLNGMGRKILLFVFAVFSSLLGSVVMPVVVLVPIGRQVIGDGPVRLKFPTSQGLRQGDVSDANRLPIAFRQHRVRDARRGKHSPGICPKIEIS
jgi:hypothetical protein